MNFLAHFLLSGEDEELRLGNLLGDVVKGRVERYAHPGASERMRDGIRLHRAIDSFSDGHAVVRRSKQRIAERYGRLAGVIVDVYYDHVLAREWATYGPGDLATYAQATYASFVRHLPRLPGEVHPLVLAMSRGRWLESYARIEGIAGALRGMAHRTPIAAGIGTAAEELRRDYALVAADVAEFFPQLQAHCADVLARIAFPDSGRNGNR